MKKLFWFLLLINPLYSCTPIDYNLSEYREQVLKIAEKKQFVRKIIETPSFSLTTFSRVTINADRLIIYLEGDGRSFDANGQLSNNPTPHQPLALELALLDCRSNVLYIARPGQYLSERKCHPKYWSSHRFSQAVVDATNEVIDEFKSSISKKEIKIELIGFSGGGGLALLVAAHRKDVFRIITVAGDLNHVAMSAYHKALPLTDSLNPINFAQKLKDIPQHHFVGKKDKVVPSSIAKSYLAANQDFESHQVFIHSIEATHHKGWLQKWPELILSID